MDRKHLCQVLTMIPTWKFPPMGQQSVNLKKKIQEMIGVGAGLITYKRPEEECALGRTYITADKINVYVVHGIIRVNK